MDQGLCLEWGALLILLMVGGGLEELSVGQGVKAEFRKMERLSSTFWLLLDPAL